MGRILAAYLVESRLVLEAVGSGNEELAESIVSASADAIARNAAWFRDEIAQGAPTLDQALRKLIRRPPTRSKHGSQFGYALEMLCGHLGRRLGHELFEDYHGDWLAQVQLPVAFLAADGVPFPLPPIQEFPAIGFMSAATASRAARHAEGADLTRPDCLDQFPPELRGSHPTSSPGAQEGGWLERWLMAPRTLEDTLRDLGFGDGREYQEWLATVQPGSSGLGGLAAAMAERLVERGVDRAYRGGPGPGAADPEVVAARHAFLEWCRDAAESGSDLVTFEY